MERRSTSLSEWFDPRRLWLLLRRDFSNGYRAVLIAMAAVGGFVVLLSVLSALGGSQRFLHVGLYVQLLFVGGIVVSSLAFREIHQNGQSIFYLTLPGSTLEKFLSKLLVSSLGYAIGALIYYTAVSSVGEGLNRLLFGAGHPFFNPFGRIVLQATAAYLVIQAVFLAGSAFFRRFAFLKTALFLILLGIGLSVIAGIALRFLLADFGWWGNTLSLEPYIEPLRRSGSADAMLLPLARGFLLALKILFWGALAPVCWLLSYLRLSETEV
jgi:hypothetical protein